MCIKGIRSVFGIADPNEQAQKNAAAATQAATDQQNAEAAREAKIAQGKQSIDSAFSGYNDDYFNNYAKANVDAATPQIEDQYNTARDKLFASLTGRGVQNSSIAGGYYSALDKTRGAAEGDAANNAADAANALRNSVQTQKNNLYSLNSTGADPSTIATQAIGSATALAPNQNYTALGDLFSNIIKPLSAAAVANNYSPFTPAYNSLGLPTKGNAKVVS
jgi:hypothetical protein